MFCTSRPYRCSRPKFFKHWAKILKGEQPSLSIEITKECPLKCPGCYAYDSAHLGGGPTLRDLNDRRGQALVDGVLEVVDRIEPLHYAPRASRSENFVERLGFITPGQSPPPKPLINCRSISLRLVNAVGNKLCGWPVQQNSPFAAKQA